MNQRLSKRLADVLAALPLKQNMRVLEIGCGPGALARAMANKISDGQVLGIDRSAKAIQQAIAASPVELKAVLSFCHIAIEHFSLKPDEEPYDLAVAIRVGVLDGRYPHLEQQALMNIKKALNPNGRLFIDGGTALVEVNLQNL